MHVIYNRKFHNKNKSAKKGGKVLSSGGFGCIFKPALKCKNQTPQLNSVSKLMKKKYVAKEYGDIVKYLPQLKKIPNYQKYFLVDGFSVCEPEPLTPDDLENFDKKCSALTKSGFTKATVNKHLTNLQAITMPYGGIDVGNYIDLEQLNFKKMHALNKSLSQLLINGIVPMNKEHIFHCDIKESNVLVEDTDESEDRLKTRLIDWGLSTFFNPTTEKKVPYVLLNRPFQYNVPFSNILFNDTFEKMYASFLKENPDPGYYIIRSFVINYTIAWIDKRGPGHLKTLNSLFRKMFEKELHNVDAKFKDDIVEFEYTFYFIFEYLSQILFKFTKNNKFDAMSYFSDAFTKNIDIWGFVIIYVPILEYLYDNYNKLNETEINIVKTIKELIFILFEYSTEPINVEKVQQQLKQLDLLFLEASQKHTFTRLMSQTSSKSFTSPSSSSSSSRSLPKSHSSSSLSKSSSKKSKQTPKLTRKLTRKLTTKNSSKKSGGSIIAHFQALHKK